MRNLSKMHKLVLWILPFILFILCSWVDPDTMDVYNCSIIKTDFNYETTNLSGAAQYYLSSYDGVALDGSGYLYNSSNVTINGRILTPYGEFSLRLPSLSGAQIYQEYVSGTSVRSTWVSYNLLSDELPSTPTNEAYIVLIACAVITLAAILGARFIMQ